MSYVLSGHIPHSVLGLVAIISANLMSLIAVFCLAFCWYQWTLVRAYCRFPSKRMELAVFLSNIPGRLPKDIPYTSYMFQALLKTANSFREEGLCVLWFFKPYVVVFNGELMKDLVNEAALADKCSLYNTNNLLFGNGLLGSNHKTWKVHRKLMNPAFNVGVLKSKMSSFNKYALQLAEKMDKQVDEPVDNVWEVLKYCIFQNMADFVLGLKMDNKRHISLAENFMKTLDSAEELIIERICRPLLYWNFLLPLSRWGRHYLKISHDLTRQMREIRDELVKKITASEKEQRNDDSHVVSSCGDIIMNLYLEDPEFTEHDVRDHLVNFASAGYDSVAITMLWCFYALGHHPEVQEKAFQEVQSIVPEGDVKYEDLAELKYLDCVIKECQRLHTMAPVIARKASKDIQCGKYTIPKGSEVCFFLHLLHRDPKIFPEPVKFDPDRFYDNSKLRPWMFMPFSEGYRNCIGKKFAMMEMKVQLVHVLRRFRITSLSKVDITDLEWTVVLKPLKPVRFLFDRRHSKSVA